MDFEKENKVFKLTVTDVEITGLPSEIPLAQAEAKSEELAARAQALFKEAQILGTSPLSCDKGRAREFIGNSYYMNRICIQLMRQIGNLSTSGIEQLEQMLLEQSDSQDNQ